ncbi:methylated-DNA--[protein]-cysteine S-methyltransferase [Halolamina sp. CBA1230]|uniref:MGMT family protein n=1 Tax=Halolamina sp. CBA1230 TaxID=1853690 RepID=UPI0009A20B74|nr:MGMT family protein [Halolamina sp. CBA1230]QKY20437.1 methylated-DNA--[protein]-cysteine S-methyltransferase [Halolamina sp. CBA1230]
MEDAGIYARESDVLGRPLQIAVASSQVIDVSFPDEIPPDAEPDHPILDRVFDYLDGQEDAFEDLEVAITVPTDQRGVLKAVCQIPYGEVGNTRQVAHMANLDPDDEDDAQTVRAALRANPVPIFVPDHRVEDAPGATPGDVAATLRRIEE